MSAEAPRGLRRLGWWLAGLGHRLPAASLAATVLVLRSRRAHAELMLCSYCALHRLPPICLSGARAGERVRPVGMVLPIK